MYSEGRPLCNKPFRGKLGHLFSFTYGRLTDYIQLNTTEGKKKEQSYDWRQFPNSERRTTDRPYPPLSFSIFPYKSHKNPEEEEEDEKETLLGKFPPHPAEPNSSISKQAFRF